MNYYPIWLLCHWNMNLWNSFSLNSHSLLCLVFVCHEKKNSFLFWPLGCWGCSLSPGKDPTVSKYVSQDADTRNQLRFFFFPLSIVLSLCFSLWFSLSLFLSHCLLSLFFFNFLNIILLLMILFCSTWKESEIQAWC
jgi:hypothetical protein